MVDSIHVHQTITEEQRANLLQLSDKEHTTSKRGEILKEEISVQGLKCVLHSRLELSVYGSLTKLALGDNTQNASRLELLQAVEAFAERTKIDLSGASLSRLDLGACLSMKFAPFRYIGRMLDYHLKTRIAAGKTSVRFDDKGGKNCLVIYDKAHEVKDKNKRANVANLGNLLRVEVRSLTTAAVRSVFGQKSGAISLKYALSVEGWERMANYLSEYVNKLTFQRMNYIAKLALINADRKTRQRLAIIRGLEEVGGKEEARELLTEAVEMGEMTKRQRKQRLADIADALRWQKEIAPDITIHEKEFRKKFAAALKKYKAAPEC